MLRETLPRDDGLLLTVSDRPTPDLRLFVSRRGRLLLRQSSAPVLLALVAADRSGVDVVRTGHYRSQIPPLRAAQARHLAGGPTRWAYRFAELLEATAGPLHNGSWLLRTRTLPPYVLREDLVRNYPATVLDWFGQGWNGAIPLRRLSEPDAPRVKAYRRQVVEGHLPPILLWWVSGLDGYLVLDGHDRLVAALAERVEPPVLVLDRAQATVDRDAWLAALTARYERALDLTAPHFAVGGAEAQAGLSRSFGRDIELSASAVGRTRAWQLPAAEWNDIAARETPDWP